MGSISIPSVVLAAGHSRRLGRPKALVQVNGKELVWWVHERLVAAGCTPVVVVNAEIESEVARLLPEAHLVVNPDPDAGRTGSLQLGIEALEVVMDKSLPIRALTKVDLPTLGFPMMDT